MTRARNPFTLYGPVERAWGVERLAAADAGGPLGLVAKRVQARGATRVAKASPISHSWADSAPDIVTRVSDALVMFPWDRQFYVNGRWQDYTE